jgi:DNA invertase Pin-like site-specific DNA recombinase
VVGAVIEENVSGRKTRPARDQLIRDARAGRYDASWSGWGCTTADLITTVRDLGAAGVVFISLQEGIDLSTPSGRLMLTILAAIAEFEADNIRENVITGLKHAKRRGTKSGKAIGRPEHVALPVK